MFESKYMSNHNPPLAFLLVVAQTEDAATLDGAIQKGKLGCQKVGDKVYLGFFFDKPAKVYSDWGSQFGI